MTTFWPDRSVDRPPSAASVDRPLRPVTMNASFGPATLIRDRMKMTSRSTSSDAAADGDEQGESWEFLLPGGRASGLLDDDAGVAGRLDDEDLGAQRHGWSARALSLTGWPPMRMRTSPYPSAGIGVTTTPSVPTRSARVGVASVRMSAPPGSAGIANQPVGTAASTPPATAADDHARGTRTEQLAGDRAAPNPNAPTKPAIAWTENGPSTSGWPKWSSGAEQGEREHADAGPADEQKDDVPVATACTVSTPRNAERPTETRKCLIDPGRRGVAFTRRW